MPWGWFGGFPNLPRSIDAAELQGVQSIRNSFPVGDVSLHLVPTGLLDHDSVLWRALNSDERFGAFLQFREETLKAAAAQLISAFNSPADLFHLAGEDMSFGAGYFYVYGMPSQYVQGDNLTSQRLNHVYRSFAYQKSLLYLDLIKENCDSNEILRKLKSLTQWSELQDSQIRTLIQRHMNILKEYHHMLQSDSNGRHNSTSESFKKYALEKINSELSSELDELLNVDDLVLMNHYCKRTNLNIIARECDAKAQMADTVILEEALPIDECKKKLKTSGSVTGSKLDVAKRKVRQSVEGCWGSLRRMSPQIGRANSRGNAAFLACSTLAVVASATWKTKEQS